MRNKCCVIRRNSTWKGKCKLPICLCSKGNSAFCNLKPEAVPWLLWLTPGDPACFRKNEAFGYKTRFSVKSRSVWKESHNDFQADHGSVACRYVHGQMSTAKLCVQKYTNQVTAPLHWSWLSFLSLMFVINFFTAFIPFLCTKLKAGVLTYHHNVTNMKLFKSSRFWDNKLTYYNRDTCGFLLRCNTATERQEVETVKAIREGWLHQIGWIFRKVPKRGGGGHFQFKTLCYRFWEL